MSKVTLEVTMDLPYGANKLNASDYVFYAVRSFSGGLEPGEMFGCNNFDRGSVRVKYKNKKRKKSTK